MIGISYPVCVCFCASSILREEHVNAIYANTLTDDTHFAEITLTHFIYFFKLKYHVLFGPT